MRAILGEEAELPGTRHCLSPVGDIQLAIDTGRVGFDGSGATMSCWAIS